MWKAGDMSYRAQSTASAAMAAGAASEQRMIPALFTVAAALTVALSIAFWPAAAEAHPLADGHADTATMPPAAAEEVAEGSPLDAGIDRAIDQICCVAVSEGDVLLDAQADMVGDQVAEQAAEASAAARAQAAALESTPAPAESTPAASTGTVLPAASVIDVDGDAMGYVDAYLAAAAPASGAGLWMGSDSTTDGSWGYFIGHNPGSFHHVMDLGIGSAITVTDRTGAARTYHVIDVFTVPDTTVWEQIRSRVTGYGESVILQTCCGDDANYRIVVAD